MRVAATILIACFTLTVVACAPAPSVTQGAIAALNSGGSGYAYELWLNGEPVLYSGGWFTTRWVGWPLVVGKNVAEIRIKEALQGASKLNINLVVRENAEDRPIIGITGEIADKEKAFRQQFTIETKVQKSTAPIAKANDPQRALRAGLKVIQAMASLNTNRILEVLVADADQIAVPKWVFANNTGKWDVQSVTLDADIGQLSGERSILIRPSEAFVRRERSFPLLRIEDKMRARVYEVPCLVFTFDEDGGLWLHGLANKAIKVKE
jgi:hypothetical protein